MTKKKVLIMAGTVAIVLVALVFIFVIRQRQVTIINPIQSPEIIQEKKPETLLSYKDTAGFEFKYPENLTVKDASGNLPVYSSLEISKAFSGEKMTVKVLDTDFPSVDTWLKSKEASGAGSSRDITLAGMSGKQVQFTNPRRLVTIVISEGIMYFIQSPIDEANLWNKAHNDIVSSFALEQTQRSTSQTGGAEDIISEEEEVIQ